MKAFFLSPPPSGIAAAPLPSMHLMMREPGGFGFSCQKAGNVHELMKVEEDSYSLFVNMHTFQQIPGFSG
jgi:hypothetical protein